MITLADVAGKSGVTAGVVSAVLGGTKKGIRFSEKTRKTVLEAVGELGYRPRRASRQMRQAREMAVGILYRNFYAIPRRAFRGVMFAAAERKMQVVLECMPEEEGGLPALLRERSVDGLLLFEDLGPDVDECLRRYDVPAIFTNTLKEDAAYRLERNEERIVADICDEFARSGKNRVAFIASGDSAHNALRRKLIEEQCRLRNWIPCAHLAVKQLGPSTDTMHQEDICRQIEKFVTSNPLIDAYILHLDTTGPALYESLRKASRRIREEVRVVGLHDDLTGRALVPSLSVINVDMQKAGHAAACLLFSIIDDVETPAQILRIPHKLIVRGT